MLDVVGLHKRKKCKEKVLTERVNDDQTRTKSQPTNLQKVYITVSVIIWVFERLDILIPWGLKLKLKKWDGIPQICLEN